MTYKQKENLQSRLADSIKSLDAAGSFLADDVELKAIDELLAARRNIDSVLKHFPEKAIEAGYAGLLEAAHLRALKGHI